MYGVERRVFLSRICHCRIKCRRREDWGAEGAKAVESGSGCYSPLPTKRSYREYRKRPQWGPG